MMVAKLRREQQPPADKLTELALLFSLVIFLYESFFDVWRLCHRYKHWLAMITLINVIISKFIIYTLLFGIFRIPRQFYRQYLHYNPKVGEFSDYAALAATNSPGAM